VLLEKETLKGVVYGVSHRAGQPPGETRTLPRTLRLEKEALQGRR
jgi:hypothetical protein